MNNESPKEDEEEDYDDDKFIATFGEKEEVEKQVKEANENHQHSSFGDRLPQSDNIESPTNMNIDD